MTEHTSGPTTPELLAALDNLLSLPVAKDALALLDKGIGTKTPNNAWVIARSIVAKAHQV